MTDLLNSVNHQNKWRIFSKLGAGWSTSRLKGEIVSNVYACVPIYDENGQDVIDGYEFTLTARGSVAQDSGLTIVEQVVFDAINNAMEFIVQNHQEKMTKNEISSD